jgi:small ligand-binding sensory domain FIST
MTGSALRVGHATHGNWRVACEIALAQVGGTPTPQRRTRRDGKALCGLIYVTEPLAGHFDQIVALVSSLRADVTWSGACVPGALAGLGEYQDEPAIAMVVGDLSLRSGDLGGPDALDVEGASGVLIHADPRCAELGDALSQARQRVAAHALFGGIVADTGHLAGKPHPAEGRIRAIAIGDRAQTWSRVTIGVRPIARPRLITSIRNRHVETLDHRPALEVLTEDLGLRSFPGTRRGATELVAQIRAAMPAQGLLIGILPPRDAPKRPGIADQRLAHLVGIEPVGRLVAIDDTAIPGERIVLLAIDPAAARTDLIRACTELREELEASGRSARLIHYVSCVARGQALFGSAGVETALIAHNFGDLPLIGFFANGEIGQGRLHGFSAILTLIA